MRKIVNVIENDFRSELQHVINDSSDEGSGKADVLRVVWEQDLKDRRAFGLIKGETVSKQLILGQITEIPI